MLNFSHTASSSSPICHLIRCYTETEKSFESFPKNNAPHFNSIQYSSASFQQTAAETQRAAGIQRSWLCQTVFTQHEWVWRQLWMDLFSCAWIRKWNSSYIASWDVDLSTWWAWFHQVQHVPGSTSLLLTNQSESRDNFSGNICFRLKIRVRCFYTFVNQLSFPTDFRNKLWVGLGLGVGMG